MTFTQTSKFFIFFADGADFLPLPPVTPFSKRFAVSNPSPIEIAEGPGQQAWRLS
jgi:hypothetical protein